MFGKDHFEKNGLFIYRRFIAYAIECQFVGRCIGCGNLFNHVSA